MRHWMAEELRRQRRDLHSLGVELFGQRCLFAADMLELGSGVGEFFLQISDVLVFLLNFLLQRRTVVLLGALVS